MLRNNFIIIFVLFAAFSAAAQMGSSQSSASEKDWTLNATIIEACSCPMFCQCYFNTEPAAHSGHSSHGKSEHFCRFNMAFKVNAGSYGNVKIDGIKFWIAGDLGEEFSKGAMDWAELTFEPSVTKEQRNAVAAMLAHVFPVTWSSFTMGKDAKMDWEYTKDRAVAKLDGGKAAEVILNRFPGNTDEPIVINNLKYWGVPRNDGFVMMPNEVQAYRVGDKPFEFKGTNGFMITFNMTSKDI